MSVLKIDALVPNLDNVLEFIGKELEKHNASAKVKALIDVAAEEIFVNIAQYAYGDNTGKVQISFEYDEAHNSGIITFEDSGAEYNPLEKEDPDVTLSADDRQKGGLGIYIVKKSMDEVKYKYEDGRNILSLVKKLS